MKRDSISAVLAVGLGLLPGAQAADAPSAKNRLLFVIAPGVNTHEYNLPFEVGRAVGYEFDLVGPSITNVVSGRGGSPSARINLLLDEFKDLSPYAGVIIPGGGSPGNLTQYPRSLEICRMIMDAKMPVLAMCHGPRLLIKAGVMKDRVFTCLPRVADELADEWKSRDCGKFVDRPLVLDRNLLTSPHFAYGESHYGRAMLDVFEANGGIRLDRRPANVVVVAAGASFQGHEKWAMTAVPNMIWTRVSLLENTAAIKSLSETNDSAFAETAGLYVLPGKDLDATVGDENFVRLASKMKAMKVLVIGINAAFGKMKGAGIECVQETVAEEMHASYIRLIVKRTQQMGRQVPKAEEGQAATAAIVLKEGYNDRQYAALRTFMDWKQQVTTVVGPKKGWMFGREGCPALIERTDNPSGDKLQYVFEVTAQGVELKKGGGDIGAAAAVFAAGATGASDDGPFTAAIALREGFDDHTYAAMRATFAWAGRKTAILGPEKGELRGLNGMVAKVSYTYGQAPDLAAGAIVVLPGGLYPDKVPQAQQAVQPPWIDDQDKRDTARMKWVMDAYTKGAVLVVSGYDGSRMAGLDECKDLSFACPVHAGSKFANKPGKMVTESARKTKDRMYSASGADSLGDLLRLLEQENLIGRTRGQ